MCFNHVGISSLILVLAWGLSNFCAGQESAATPEDLFDAARAGDVDRITRILDEGIDVDATTAYGATALMYAAEKGHLEAVKFLVAKGADVNAKDTFYGATPLSWANMSKRKEIAAYLKENGAELPIIRSSSSTKKKEDKADAETAEEEAAAAPEFLPSSPESRLADREVSGVHWPQFRGTGGRGIADGQNPPREWNVGEGKNLLWMTAIDGLGHSCPVIWGDQIFITSAISGKDDHSIKPGLYGSVDSVDDESEHRFMVYCLDKNDGEILWQRQAAKAIPQVKRHLKSTHANSTVATNGDHVIAFFGSEGLYCYNTGGELLWKKDLGMLDSGWFYDKSYQWGFGSSPVIFEDMVIVQCDIQTNSFVAAYRLSDGSLVWRSEREEIPGWSSPTVVDSPRGPMLLTHATKFARGYSARTGEEIWRLGGHSEIVVPTPFVAHDLIFLASGYRPIQPIVALSLEAEGDVTLDEGETTNEHVVWSQPRGGPYMPSPIVYGDYLYSCNNRGILTCIRATTGQQVYQKRLTEGLEDLNLKQSDIGGTLSMVGSPVAADGHIYFPSENGTVLVVEAGPEFRLVAVNRCGETILTTPAISEGVLYIRGQQHLIALKRQD